MNIHYFNQHASLKTKILMAVFIMMAMMVTSILADDGRKLGNRILGGNLACGSYYTTNGIHYSSWKLSNLTEVSMVIERIRVYKSDGSIYRDYQWQANFFVDANGSGSVLPVDLRGNLSNSDNELGPFQTSLYPSGLLVGAGVIPGGVGAHMPTIVIDWVSERPAYPLSGIVIRSQLQESARTQFTIPCHTIQSVPAM